MHHNSNRLEDVAAELAAREPIFHRPELGTARADFDRMMAAEFREVGASGRLYNRETVLEILEQRHRESIEENLVVSEFRCEPLSVDCYLVTYLLDQSGRISRRSTLWRKIEKEWKIVYHQGTLVQDSHRQV